MAPSAGHLHKLMAKNIKLLRLGFKKATRFVQSQFPDSRLQPVFVRAEARHPIHPKAFLRQSKGRWYHTHSAINAAVRRFTTSSGLAGVKYDKASFPKSRTASYVNASAGRAPFASTLRPNLTGGTLGRTAGGYSIGSGRIGGARYFSHGPAQSQQVVQNVSQAVRAFFLSGQKVQYNGSSPVTGEKRYKAVTSLQEETSRKMRSLPKATPGSYIDFNVNPTITALTPLNTVAGFSYSTPEVVTSTLNSDGLLDTISVDFSRALKDLAAVLNDLKRLSALGDLPITYRSSSLRVHFPGCDAGTVESLCNELGVQRGIIIQDEDFDSYTGTEIALLFPFAPSDNASECSFYEKDTQPVAKHPQKQDIDWHHMVSSSEDFQLYSDTSTQSDYEQFEPEPENPWATSSPSGYHTVRSSELGSEAMYEPEPRHSPLEYQGFEGVCRFIEQCDAAQRR
ncbi:MAG: hypothetical protein M1821_003436 [Bathelium mastoideum]|nr:MAG: hypothetical protein M1821_003436 [Bathelium mastoideum]